MRHELINDLIASDFVDATTIREDKARLSKVGEVIVKVYRDSKAKPAKNNHLHSNFNSYEKVVHEKAVKGEAKSHGIMYDSAWLDT